MEVAGDGSRAEEWSMRIPDFDPNSLASTPRPVYRRKRPVPSAMNGFNISAPRCSDDAKRGVEVLAPPSAAVKTVQAGRSCTDRKGQLLDPAHRQSRCGTSRIPPWPSRVRRPPSLNLVGNLFLSCFHDFSRPYLMFAPVKTHSCCPEQHALCGPSTRC